MTSTERNSGHEVGHVVTTTAFGATAPLSAVATFVSEDLARRGVTFTGPMVLKLPFPPFTKCAPNGRLDSALGF